MFKTQTPKPDRPAFPASELDFRLVDMREKDKLTFEQIAEQLGRSKQNVYKLFKRAKPRVDYARRDQTVA